MPELAHELAHNAERDFWRPPVATPAVAIEPTVPPAMIEVCDRCETEFIPDSRFCHVCGAERTEHKATARLPHWTRAAVTRVRQLEFQNVERWIVSARQKLGLPTAALVSFSVGIICLAGAVVVGLIFTVQTTLDWQAVQVWRIEWLLGATASFLAGILLKKSTN